jgi:hypothetical protein
MPSPKVCTALNRKGSGHRKVYRQGRGKLTPSQPSPLRDCVVILICHCERPKGARQSNYFQ